MELDLFAPLEESKKEESKKTQQVKSQWTAPSVSYHPLAHRARPQNWQDFAGHEKLLKSNPWLMHKDFPGFILWGPPGCGKTTLAGLIAKQSGRELYKFNAVLGGVSELKKLIQRAKEMQELHALKPLVFVDEIHRFNKAQQDALLPYVENGQFALIGATTQNPRVCVNKALLSRVRTIALSRPTVEEIENLLKKIITTHTPAVPFEVASSLAKHCGGDIRQALGALESIAMELEENPTLDAADYLKRYRTSLLEAAREYDLDGNRHYDVISAFIKSVRGSDPDAALLWMAVMLEGGEDPVFIARRLMILASEDVGNADAMALNVATNALVAVQNIGMPEARIILAQVVVYLAMAPKSNASYMAINKAMDYVKNNPAIEVPEHLKNFPQEGTKPYLYPHQFDQHFIKQIYAPLNTPEFYLPSTQGEEKKHKKLNQKSPPGL